LQGIFACSITLIVTGGAAKLGYTQALHNVMTYIAQFLPEFTSQLQEAAVYAPATVRLSFEWYCFNTVGCVMVQKLISQIIICVTHIDQALSVDTLSAFSLQFPSCSK
jgi:hypothetical protein